MRPRDPLHLLHNIICAHTYLYSFTFCNGTYTVLLLLCISSLYAAMISTIINICICTQTQSDYFMKEQSLLYLKTIEFFRIYLFFSIIILRYYNITAI